MGKFLYLSFFDLVDTPEATAINNTFVPVFNTTSRQFIAYPVILLPLLTDNSAGTADSTIQAMPSPADTPASADVLRDDLVANFIPAVRNNIADLAAKVNVIIDLLTVP